MTKTTLKKHASLRGTSNINENSNVAYARGLNSHNEVYPKTWTSG